MLTKVPTASPEKLLIPWNRVLPEELTEIVRGFSVSGSASIKLLAAVSMEETWPLYPITLPFAELVGWDDRVIGSRLKVGVIE